MQIHPCGDHSISVAFENKVDEEVNQRVIQFCRAVEQNEMIGITELIPSFRCVLIQYDPMKIRYDALKEKMEEVANDTAKQPLPEPSTTIVPVRYGGEYGMDIDFVAEHNGLHVDEVIKLHSGRPYYIYMIGFIAGFPYLGGMDERLCTPRLETPRVKIPAGSVGIANEQTGVYPLESPGGWQIIGRTPLDLWDSENNTALLSPGNYVQFEPITEEEFKKLCKGTGGVR